MDVEQLANDGYRKVFERLDKGFQFDPLTELPGDFERFFISLNRRAGQTLQDYTQEFTHAERRLRTIHKGDLPEKVKAWFFLRRSGLSREKRLMVLSSVGHEMLDLDNVQKTMNFVIGQDTKLEGSRWNRKDPVMYQDESFASTPWPEEESWDYNTTNEATYYEEDFDQTWPDYDACYFEESGDFQENDLESEIFDVDEYDNVLANFVEARSKLNQVRTNRGFYPVVALVDPNNMRSGSNKGKSKAKGSRRARQRVEAHLHHRKEVPRLVAKHCLEVVRSVSDVVLLDIKPATVPVKVIARGRSMMERTQFTWLRKRLRRMTSSSSCPTWLCRTVVLHPFLDLTPRSRSISSTSWTRATRSTRSRFTAARRASSMAIPRRRFPLRA